MNCQTISPSECIIVPEDGGVRSDLVRVKRRSCNNKQSRENTLHAGGLAFLAHSGS